MFYLFSCLCLHRKFLSNRFSKHTNITFVAHKRQHSAPCNELHLARSEPQKGNTTNHINHLLISIWVRVMVFNATFNNISVIYTAETPRWSSVLLLEETGVPGENHPPVASHWQTLSNNVVSSTPRHERYSNSQR